MSDSIFPTAEIPEIVQESQYDENYKPSVAWDSTAGDFVRSSSHRMVQASGREAYKTWCLKMAMTERYTCLSYPAELGAEIESAMKEDSDSAVESAIERTITEALLVNPRTEYVRDFTFTREADNLYCSFVVKGVEWDEFPVSVNLTNNLEVKK